jgi:cardiolipin synthase
VRHVPNALTLLRLLLIPVQVALLAQHRYDTALLLFAFSAASDVADGFIARHWNARTRFGAIADPIADKLTMLAVTLMLAAQGWLPLWLAAAIVARDLVIVAGALAYHCVVGRYDMAPTALSKLNTGVEFLVLALVLAGAAGALDIAPLRPLMFALLLATIVVSGTHYVWTWGRRARSRYRERHRASRH